MSSAKLMDWTAQLRQEFRTALLGACRDRAMLQDFVARLGEPDLDAVIASGRDLARTCADLLEYADSRGWLDRLYGEFVALHPERTIGQDAEARSAPLQLRRYRRKNQGFNENLGEGVQLTMMRIPAGTFLMGAPVVSKFVLALPVPSSILPVPSRPATAPNPSLQVSPAALDCAIAPPKNPLTDTGVSPVQPIRPSRSRSRVCIDSAPPPPLLASVAEPPSRALG